MSLDRLEVFEPCRRGFVVACNINNGFMPVWINELYHMGRPTPPLHSWLQALNAGEPTKAWFKAMPVYPVGWHVWHEQVDAQKYLLRKPGFDHPDTILACEVLNPLATGYQTTSLNSAHGTGHWGKVTVCEYRRLVEVVYPCPTPTDRGHNETLLKTPSLRKAVVA